MHKLLSSIGFSAYQKKRDINALLDSLTQDISPIELVQIDKDTNFCEIRKETAPGMGLVIAGEMDEAGEFHREYYYPYMTGSEVSSTAECSIQRHTEKETFAGLLDEMRVGISLIFYLDNAAEYQKRKMAHESLQVAGVRLAGLANSGKVILPLYKTQKQINKAKVVTNERNSRIEAAKNGDEEAMESLTIEDIDLYSKISRRMIKEDIYSIIDSCFMPCGIECDQYAIIGEIKQMELVKNRYTDEEVYNLMIECNDMTFHVGIAKNNLTGEPAVGRRFKGQIWMLGRADFDT